MRNLFKWTCALCFLSLCAVALLITGTDHDRAVIRHRESTNFTSEIQHIYNNGTPGQPTTKSEQIAHTNASNSHWIIISVSITPKMAVGYVFCMPIVIAGWKRIDWQSIVIITGDVKYWNESPLLQLVRQTIHSIDDTVRFVTIPVDHNPVAYAQLSRLFITILTPWVRADDIVMTSDVDLVPLKRTIFDEVKNVNGIYILNADCCGVINARREKYNMQPMSAIGMTSENWKQLMDLRSLQFNETFPEYLDSWLSNHHRKPMSKTDVQKGDNLGWYTDQLLISYQLYHSNIMKWKFRRNTGRDRVDRAYPRSWHSFLKHTDAHLYLDRQDGDKWQNIALLISAVFTNETANILKLYQEQFVLLNSIDTKS